MSPNQSPEEKMADAVIACVKTAIGPMQGRLQALERQRTEDAATLDRLREQIAALRERLAVAEARA